MGLKQKFMALSGLMGLLLAIVSIVGYYMASSALRESVDSELRTTISSEANELNGWLKEKKAFGVATTNHMTSLNGNMEVMHTQETLGTTISDKEILEMTAGTEDGWFSGYYSGENTGKKDPRQRPWYKDAKAIVGGGYNRVCIGSFETEQEAYSMVRQLKADNVYEQSWVLKRQ